MNTKSLILALATFAAAGGAFAQEATPDTWSHDAKSVATRAEVHGQAVAALTAGRVQNGEVSQFFEAPRAATPALTRTQVRAEAVEALRLGVFRSGEAVTRVPTASDLASIREAGLKAVQVRTASIN